MEPLVRVVTTVPHRTIIFWTSELKISHNLQSNFDVKLKVLSGT